VAAISFFVPFIISFLVFYIWHIMGVTVGYHRLLSHRSFRCPKFVEYFWVLGGYLAFEGSPIWWASIHRAHHRYTDTPLDPHSPRESWFASYIGWTTKGKYADHIRPQDAKDLCKDPIYQFLEQGGSWEKAHLLCAAIGTVFRLGLLACFGWPIALGCTAAGLFCLNVPLMLNLFCHIPKLGYKNFETKDDSVNVWWVAALTMGEGWHNNHHAFPGSARSGFKRNEIDPSWETIKLMKKVGLVSWFNEANPDSKAPAKVKPTLAPVAARTLTAVPSTHEDGTTKEQSEAKPRGRKIRQRKVREAVGARR